nr:cysteine-rich receptor-like protein kinase [Tanacetum cinerariifolium]
DLSPSSQTANKTLEQKEKSYIAAAAVANKEVAAYNMVSNQFVQDHFHMPLLVAYDSLELLESSSRSVHRKRTPFDDPRTSQVLPEATSKKVIASVGTDHRKVVVVIVIRDTTSQPLNTEPIPTNGAVTQYRNLAAVKAIAGRFSSLLEVGRLNFDANILTPVKTLILTYNMRDDNNSMDGPIFEKEAIGPSMEGISLNCNGLGCVNKKSWIKGLIECDSPFFEVQETKLGVIDDSIIHSISSRSFVDYAYSCSISAYGGILTMWDFRVFSLENKVCDRNFVLVVGSWDGLSPKVGFINIYAPQAGLLKEQLWLTVEAIINSLNDVVWIVFSDFNVVRHHGERVGSSFDHEEENMFNDFISHAGLFDFPLNGRLFTRFDKGGKKVSKLDRLSDYDASFLELPISLDEIKEAIWGCESSKSPGPDGLKFKFLKYYQDTLKAEFIGCIKYFEASGIIASGCNISFVVLIPKKAHPLGFSDYRPISLIKCIYKVVSKILANWLAKVISSVIGPNQTTFLVRSQILDGCIIANEIIRMASFEKLNLLLFKVDFEKAFDSVKWETILSDVGKGGLGVGSLLAKNLSLLCKWKWRFLTKKEALRCIVITELYGADGGFSSPSNSCSIGGIWCDIVKAINKVEVVENSFKISSVLKVSSGPNTLFWRDPWCGNGGRLMDTSLRLFALEIRVDCKVNKHWSLFNGMWGGTWSWHIIPLGRALDDLSSLIGRISELHLVLNGCDKWAWFGDGSGSLKVRNLVKNTKHHILSDHLIGMHHQWNSWIPWKVNICTWRASLNRLPTRQNLSLRGVLLPSTTCSFCEEDIKN